MKDIVVRPFAIECGLQADTAFDLLDTFFEKEYKRLNHFMHVENRIQQFQQQVQNLLPAAPGFL